jgi:tRNA (cmo5U34)-methyltransferase
MEKVKDHFDGEAQDFDRIILNLIPHYSTMIRAMVEAIPFECHLPLNVIDLGCGTGTVAMRILESFPNAHLTCLDFSENMIAIAQKRLAQYPSVKFILSDVRYHKIDTKYDAVISSLALHHLPSNRDKFDFYHHIYENLNPGGVFYNADVVLASNDYLQTLYMNEWREFMIRNVSIEEVEAKWMSTYQQEDHPSRLNDQLIWLKDIGYVDIDVIWKYFNFAVYGGTRRENTKGACLC